MRLHRRGCDPVRRHHLLLHVRWNTQQRQLLCIREQYSRRAVQEAGWLSYIAAKAEYRQENMTLGSADFLLKFCIAENNELGANIPELNSIND